MNPYPFLSEAEEVALKKFIDNPVLMNAVKKMFLKDVYDSGTLKEGQTPDYTRNFCLSLLYNSDLSMEYKINNQELGEKLRACIEGLRVVNCTFNRLENLRDVKPTEDDNVNPAK